jgi:hypothetical protein
VIFTQNSKNHIHKYHYPLSSELAILPHQSGSSSQYGDHEKLKTAVRNLLETSQDLSSVQDLNSSLWLYWNIIPSTP